MTLTGLRTFLAIVETGSLVRASEQLNVTQSTVTSRLKTLEDDLGQVLLLRQKSGATLTPAGLKFKRYADVMVGLWRQARQETSLPDGVEALCNIGCHVDLWDSVGRTLFDALFAQQPDTALSVWHGSDAELEQRLTSGLIDVAVTFRPSVREGQTAHPLPPQRLILIGTSPDAPTRFDPHYIYFDAGEEFGRRHAEEYADAGTAKISFTSAQWALSHLLANGGSAYLPEAIAADHIESGRLHRLIEAPTFSRTPYLVAKDAATEASTGLKKAIVSLAA